MWLTKQHFKKASSWAGEARNEVIFIYELFISGDFQFAIASDDNSELWLSSDESPLNARLLVYVGQVCMKYDISLVEHINFDMERQLLVNYCRWISLKSVNNFKRWILLDLRFEPC